MNKPLNNYRLVGGKFIACGETSNQQASQYQDNPEEQSNIGGPQQQAKKRVHLQKMAADKISLYERLSQPRRRNNPTTSSHNTNGSKEGSTEKQRKTSGSQKGSIKQKAKRKAAGLTEQPGSRMMGGGNIPTTLLRQQVPFQPVRQQVTERLSQQRVRVMRTQGSAEEFKGNSSRYPEDIVLSGPGAQARAQPRGDSSKQLRASKHKLKGVVGQVTVPSKLTLQQANINGARGSSTNQGGVQIALHLRQSSRISERREGHMMDLPKQQLAVNRIPTKLPAYRQDIFAFLTNFRDVASPTEVQNPYHGSQGDFSGSCIGEQSHQSTSAESNKPYDPKNPHIGKRPLLPPDETAYLRLYGRELFEDMTQSEYKSQFKALLTNQVKITRQLRAAVIDWLFEVGTKINIEDKQVLFQAVYLMDKFYSESHTSHPSKDLQLTAVTALFIASKNLEVDPLDLKTCVSTLCFNKYSKTAFLEKEAAIRQATDYENESPCCLDFIMLYSRLLKLQLQEKLNCSEESLQFLLDVQTIAYDICKSVTLDASILKYKPSVLAACMLFLGFQLQFELSQKHFDLSTACGRKKIGQICEIYRTWYQILEQALHMEEVPKVVDFCDMLFERQIGLYEEYANQFKNIYRDRVAEYFTRAPKRVVDRRGLGQSRTQESPTAIQQSMPLYLRNQPQHHYVQARNETQQQQHNGGGGGLAPPSQDTLNPNSFVDIQDQDHFTRSPYRSSSKQQQHQPHLPQQSSPNFKALKRDPSACEDEMMIDESNSVSVSPAKVGMGHHQDHREDKMQGIIVDSEMLDEAQSSFYYEKV